MATEKKQGKNMQNRTNGVVITVYVESSRTRSSKLSEGPMNQTTKPYPPFKTLQTAGTHGYDRRAQLLAYSKQLRNEGSKKVQVQLPHNESRPKTKASSLFSSLANAWLSSNTKNVLGNGCHAMHHQILY
ncbi:hypothetical protein SESBI_02572 [Sesbania bispinosa]|nr:hypothetical protein SESBI_02572 [Sesbania bispinosa]